MAERQIGSLVGKVQWRIDRNSWNHINRFQKELKKTKRLMDDVRNLRLGNVSGGRSGGAGGSARSSRSRRSDSMRGLGEAINRSFTERNSGASAANTAFADQLRREEAAQRAVNAAHTQAVAARERVNIATERYSDLSNRLVRRGKITQRFQRDLTRQVQQLGLAYQRGTISLNRYRFELSRVTQQTRQAAASSKTLFQRLSGFRGMIIGGMGAVGLSIAKDFMEVGQRFESLDATMIKASGSLQEARKDMAWVAKEANKMGVDIGFAADGFVKLAVAGKEDIGLDNVKQLFLGYSQYATSVGASKFRFEKGLMALSQMLSKGKVSAEELRQQLGEQIPGAVQVFSKAMGMSTKALFKAMEDGKLYAKDVLPLVSDQFKLAANEGGAYTQMLQTNRVKMGQLKNTFDLFKKDIFEGGYKNGLNYLFDSLKDFVDLLSGGAPIVGKTIGGIMKTIILPFRFAIGFFSDTAHWLGLIKQGINDLAKADGVTFLNSKFKGLGDTLRFVVDSFKYLFNAFSSFDGQSNMFNDMFQAVGLYADDNGKGGLVNKVKGWFGDSETQTPISSFVNQKANAALTSTKAPMTPVVINNSGDADAQSLDINLNVNSGTLTDLITATIDEDKSNMISNIYNKHN